MTNVKEDDKKMRILELYSGIGGMHYAVHESKVDGTVVASMDINTVANEVYKHNFPETLNLSRNIEALSIEEIAKLKINCILMSPPCQPFTRIGLKKDSADKRTTSLHHILQLIPKLETLTYILLENVKGFETSNMRNDVILCLKNSGFNFKEFLFSPCQFGIPNSRLRYYLIAKKQRLKLNVDDNIPDTCLDIISREQNCQQPSQLRQILEDNVDPQYLIPARVLSKHWRVLDIRTADSYGSCCFTKAYTHYMDGSGSVFCSLSKEIMEQTFKELNDTDQMTDDKLQTLLELRLRYFTPLEVSRIMCFPKDFSFPSNITTKQKYRLLGNSINVYVVSFLIKLLVAEKF